MWSVASVGGMPQDKIYFDKQTTPQYLNAGDEVFISHLDPTKRFACAWLQDKKWHRFKKKKWQDKGGWISVEKLAKIQKISSPPASQWIGHWVDETNHGTVVIKDAGNGLLNIGARKAFSDAHFQYIPGSAVSVTSEGIDFVVEKCDYHLRYIGERLIVRLGEGCGLNSSYTLYKKVMKNTSEGFQVMDPDEYSSVENIEQQDKWKTCDHHLFETHSQLFPSFKEGIVTGAPKEKVFFYENRFNHINCPEGSPTECQRKNYLISGDKIIILEHPTRPNPRFSCALFLNQKGQETIGWIPSANVTSVKPMRTATVQDWSGDWVNNKTGDKVTLSPAGNEQLKIVFSSREKDAPHINTDAPHISEIAPLRDKYREQSNVLWVQGRDDWMTILAIWVDSLIILIYNSDVQGIYIRSR